MPQEPPTFCTPHVRLAAHSASPHLKVLDPPLNQYHTPLLSAAPQAHLVGQQSCSVEDAAAVLVLWEQLQSVLHLRPLLADVALHVRPLRPHHRTQLRQQGGGAGGGKARRDDGLNERVLTGLERVPVCVRCMRQLVTEWCGGGVREQCGGER